MKQKFGTRQTDAWSYDKGDNVAKYRASFDHSQEFDPARKEDAKGSAAQSDVVAHSARSDRTEQSIKKRCKEDCENGVSGEGKKVIMTFWSTERKTRSRLRKSIYTGGKRLSFQSQKKVEEEKGASHCLL